LATAPSFDGDLSSFFLLNFYSNGTSSSEIISYESPTATDCYSRQLLSVAITNAEAFISSSYSAQTMKISLELDPSKVELPRDIGNHFIVILLTDQLG